MSGVPQAAIDGGGDAFQTAPPADLQTLVEVTDWRAATQPDAPAFTFLNYAEQLETTLSYEELDRRARLIAAHLVRQGAAGQSVLIVFDPGVEYVSAFFGCLYAGAVAVPVYPPDPMRLHRTLPRLQAIIRNAGADCVLTNPMVAEQAQLRQLHAKLVLDCDGESPLEAPVPAALNQRSLSLLQYTSGSTGTPRGVIVRHANMMHNFRAMHRVLDVDHAVVVHWLPPYHDMGLIGCLLLPIYSGRHTIAMSPLAFVQQPVRWLEAIDRFRGTTSGAPNFGYELCVRKIKPQQCEGLDLSSWRVAAAGAEPVRSQTLTAFCERFGPCGFAAETFQPSYGLAEATLVVSSAETHSRPLTIAFDAGSLQRQRAVPAQPRQQRRTLVGCGRAVNEVEVQIIDPETRRPLAPGDVGEIWVRSPGVGDGYWRNPKATAATFGAATADGRTGYLRTGDLGFLYQDELFIAGRRKELIIIGGRNLYPLDLELAVQAVHPDLKADGGAAFSIDVDGEEKLVVVQEVLRPKRNDLQALLQGVLRALAEEAGVTPHAVLLISAGTIPKTSSGKTRRLGCRSEYLAGSLRVLAQWPPPESDDARAAQPPATGIERKLAPIWEEVLGVVPINRSDDFFVLGGQSLRVAAMLGRVSEQLQVEVPPRELFRNPTLTEFARVVEQRLSQQQPLRAAALSLDPLEPGSRLPLTDSQHRFWFLEQLGAADGKLHLALRVVLQGNLDLNQLRQRVRLLTHRYDMLRARFGGDEQGPWQEIAARSEMPWVEVDFRKTAGQELESELEGWRNQLQQQPFALDSPPLARAGIARVSEDEWQLVLVLHHLIADGWSAGLLLRELADTPPSGVVGELPPPFAAFAKWRSEHPDPDLAGDREYWAQRLADAPQVLQLPPVDGPRAGSGCRRVVLSTDLTRSISRLARSCGATEYMVHLAAFQILLARYTGMAEFCIGTATANRNRPALENIVGCFINTLVVRSVVQDDPEFGELVTRVRDRLLADLEHAAYPFEQLVSDLRPARMPDRLPLVQAMFVYQDLPAPPSRLAAGRVMHAEATAAGMGDFDLALSVQHAVDGVAAEMSFRRDRVDAAMVDRLLDAYADVLRAVVDEPQQRISQVPVPSRGERMELLVDWNATDRRLDAACPVAMIGLQARKSPRATAVAQGDRSWTFDELDRRSNQVAAALQTKGVGPDTLVGLLMPRTPEMLAAMLGILKAGGAYVPLDCAFPPQRLEAIWQDATPALVICGDEQRSLLPAAANTLIWSQLCEQIRSQSRTAAPRAPVSHASGDHLAYVIYTSGSTGTPKGVMVTRQGVANFLQSFARVPGLSGGERVLAHTTISFDISVLELLLPLTVGATIVLAPSGVNRDPHGMAELLEEANVGFLQSTPSSFRMLLATGWKPHPLLRLVCGGEAMPPDLAAQLAGAGELWNVYGPTETTIWSTIHRVAAAGDNPPPIGKPIDNTRVYVMDQHGLPAPRGVPGELWIGGLGVARGYWKQDSLTRQRFPADQFDNPLGHSVYRTGDRVRWRDDGELEFLGRGDNQVKVRGFRVELGEIEAALLNCPQVREAAVACLPECDNGDTSLVAYCVPEPAADEHALRSLRDALARTLPEYMVPSAIVALPALPRTAAGKLDRRSLPGLHDSNLQTSAKFVAPETPLQEQVASYCREILGRQQIGVHDNFFELGGHSLKATRLLARIEAAFDVRVQIAEFFERPTVAAVCDLLLAAIAQQQPDALEQLLGDIEHLTDEEAAQRVSDPARPPFKQQ